MKGLYSQILSIFSNGVCIFDIIYRVRIISEGTLTHTISCGDLTHTISCGDLTHTISSETFSK